MSLPTLLLVDDSQAILAYEQQVLAGFYRTLTASSGEEALERLGESTPDAVLLDLSMPELDGDVVLARMRADPSQARIPVIIISSELERGRACLSGGAQAFLPKPLQAEALRAVVHRVLEEARRRALEGGLCVLEVGVGPRGIGLPLDCVRLVTLLPATRPLAIGPSYFEEAIDLHGKPVCVLDLARPLRTAHRVPPEDRKLVVVAHRQLLLALCVDWVLDPQDYQAGEVLDRSLLSGDDPALLADSIKAAVRSAQGIVPVVDPGLLFSRQRLRALTFALARASAHDVPGVAHP